MENVVLTNLSIPEIRQLFRQELETYFEASKQPEQQPTPVQPEQLLTVQEAANLLHLTVPTIYSKHSKGELPGVCKRGKRLYFSRQSLIEWIKEGRKKSNAEIEQEAESYLKKKGGKK